MDVEQTLKNIDFSRFSKTRESLLQEMLLARNQSAWDGSVGIKRELELDELDYVAAARGLMKKKEMDKK